MDNTKAKIRYGAPLVALVLLAIIALVAQLLMMARDVDARARRHEESLVTNGLVSRIDEVAHKVVVIANWDLTVANIDNAYDLAWVRANVGSVLTHPDQFAVTAILDGEDKPKVGFLRQEIASPWRYQPYVAAAAPLIRKVRQREALQGRLKPRPNYDEVISTGLQDSAIARLPSGVYLLTATLVQPDFGRSLIKGKRAPILVTAMPIGQAVVQTFADRFLLREPHIEERGEAAKQPNQAHVPLRDADGVTVATLDWTPQRPGRELLDKSLPAILVVVLGLGGAALVMGRRSRRITVGLMASEARAKHMALHDSLTGLPNRVCFEERLHQSIERIRRNGLHTAVLCIDLDRFKVVNDTFGHHAGDELIREAARRLIAVCRTGDTVARLGGDEFAVVANDIDPAGAAVLGERVVTALSGPLDLTAGRVFLGCSVGVSMLSGGDDVPTLATDAVRQADMALYRAKEQGRGRYCFFESEMDLALKARRALELDLREALTLQTIGVAYQPQVDKQGQMVAVEALARWNHPVRGQIPPSQFVPLAEECGLMEALGRIVMRQAFLDSQRWPSLRVAVNVSATQLRSPTFVDRVVELLNETGAPASRFELEITEGVLLGDDTETHTTLKRLRELGFTLALDDFGTGYSSLSYLRRYPINRIKIDRSFVVTLGRDAESEALVGAIIKLGHSLNLEVVAEGVETEDQRQRLADLGCTHAQGYLFSQPVEAAAIDVMIPSAPRLREVKTRA